MTKSIEQEVEEGRIQNVLIAIDSAKEGSEYMGTLIRRASRLLREYKAKYGHGYLVNNSNRRKVNGF